MASGSRFKISKKEFVSFSIMFAWLMLAALLKDIFPMALNWYGIVFAFFSVYSWKAKTGDRWFSLHSIFMVFFVAFNYGVPILWAIGVHGKVEFGTGRLFYSNNYVPSQADIVNAQLYTCLCMLVFHIGAMLTAKRKAKEQIGSVTASDDPIMLVSLKRVSGVILLVMAPLAIGYSLYSLSIARRYGYAALYYGQYQVQSGYIPFLMSLFFPALVGYMIGCGYSLRSRIICYSVFAVYMLLNLIMGDRGSWIYSLIIFIWLHAQYKRVSAGKLLRIFLVGVVGLYFLQIITNIRDIGINNLTSENIKDSIAVSNFPLFSALREMGGSMSIILFWLHTGNSIYPYPNTYLIAFLGMISTRMLSLFGFNPTLIADWFSQQYLHLSYGTGFSMIGEAYVNGGYIGGLVYMFIYGVLFAKLLSGGKKLLSKNRPLYLFVMAAGLNIAVGLVRGALYLTLKQFFYFVVFYAVIVWMLNNVLKHKDKYTYFKTETH